jgi:electron transfer flavoprotein beta subunit
VKLAVCIKRVPDTESRIRIGAAGRAIDEAGVKFVLNPYDEYAVEEALTLRDAAGGGDVLVVSVGGDATQETIRAALAMGADRGLLLRTAGPIVDPLAAARLLADALQDGGFDLILCGKLAIDDYSHAVGTMVAELLARPSASAVAHLTVSDGRAVAEREIEGGVEVIDLPLPAVITCDKGLNEPRYPALKGIMMAKKKPLEIRDVTPPEGGMTLASLALPPERAAGRIVGEGPDAVEALITALRTEAKVL